MTEVAEANLVRRLHLNVSSYVHWAIRLVLAGSFLFHGIDKFGAGLENVAALFGFSVPVAFLVAAGEIAVGLAFLIGGLPVAKAHIATRLGGLGMAVIMTGAIAIVHWGRWAFAPADGYPAGGMEYQTLLVALGLLLAVKGNDI